MNPEIYQTRPLTRFERLSLLQTYDEQLSMLYMWIKQGVITKQEFSKLIKTIGE